MKILLTQPAPDSQYKNPMCTPPLGLIVLYSVLPDGLKERTVMLDGNLVSNGDIISYIEREEPGIVGVSANTYTYHNALRICKAAKEAGSLVVVGGPHTTNINFLPGMQGIDFIIKEQRGEAIFRDIATGDIIKGDKSILRPRFNWDYTIPSLDYSILHHHESTRPQKYMDHFSGVGVMAGVQQSMSIFSQYGCSNYGKKHCKFCVIPKTREKMSEGNFESSLRNLLEQTDADHLWIVNGDLTGDLEHAKELSKVIKRVKRKSERDFGVYCFVRADNVLEKGAISVLKKVGVTSVLVGYEHGDDKVLEAMGKETTVAQNLEATKRLADADIEVTIAAMVLGTPAETYDSLENAVKFAEDLKGIGNVQRGVANLVHPLPGSPYWHQFLKALPHQFRKLRRDAEGDGDFREELLKELPDTFTRDYLSMRDDFDLDEIIVRFQEVARWMPGGSEDRPSIEMIKGVAGRIEQILGCGIEWREG